jgi:hypothetical protein
MGYQGRKAMPFFSLHLLQRSERLFERRPRIDAVKLVEIDAAELKPAQTHLNALDEVSGPAHILGPGRALAGDAAFGGDDQAGGVGQQGFGDEALGDLRSVGVRRVEERYAEFDGAAQNATSIARVCRFAPCAIAHEPHSAVAQAMHGQIAADLKSAACRGVGIFGFHAGWMLFDGSGILHFLGVD